MLTKDKTPIDVFKIYDKDLYINLLRLTFSNINKLKNYVKSRLPSKLYHSIDFNGSELVTAKKLANRYDTKEEIQDLNQTLVFECGTDKKYKTFILLKSKKENKEKLILKFRNYSARIGAYYRKKYKLKTYPTIYNIYMPE